MSLRNRFRQVNIFLTNPFFNLSPPLSSLASPARTSQVITLWPRETTCWDSGTNYGRIIGMGNENITVGILPVNPFMDQVQHVIGECGVYQAGEQVLARERYRMVIGGSRRVPARELWRRSMWRTEAEYSLVTITTSSSSLTIVVRFAGIEKEGGDGEEEISYCSYCDC